MTITIMSMTRLNREPNKQGIKHLAYVHLTNPYIRVG